MELGREGGQTLQVPHDGFRSVPEENMNSANSGLKRRTRCSHIWRYSVPFEKGRDATHVDAWLEFLEKGTKDFCVVKERKLGGHVNYLYFHGTQRTDIHLVVCSFQSYASS
jgi:hypothetical protein